MPDVPDPQVVRLRQQAELIQRWLKLAPPPPPRGLNSYDVFISYRSADRHWALALYDALKLAGWEPFLDQYELVPGANLQTSLEEGLQASSCGVILWSSRTKDSEWCRRERNGMSTLKDANANFHYVFGKLDSEPLPLFARSDLYVGFEDTPDGPRGVNLLKLMCGMKGVPLSEEAVREAQRADEAIARILLQIRAAIDSDNANRLTEIATSADAHIVASSGPVLEAARGLISMNKCEQALEVLVHAEANFPDSIGAKQLRGLALRRLKRSQEAIEVLSELKAAGHQDPETLGILAAAWYVRYQETGKLIDLRRSRELYRTAFQADPSSYYAGVNAAAKSLLLGETEEAANLSATVLPLVKGAIDGKDFWAACSLGQVYLMEREIACATEAYQKVIDCYPSRIGDLASTREQAEKLCAALELKEEETNKVLAPFNLVGL